MAELYPESEIVTQQNFFAKDQSKQIDKAQVS